MSDKLSDRRISKRFSDIKEITVEIEYPSELRILNINPRGAAVEAMGRLDLGREYRIETIYNQDRYILMARWYGRLSPR